MSVILYSREGTAPFTPNARKAFMQRIYKVAELSRMRDCHVLVDCIIVHSDEG